MTIKVGINGFGRIGRHVLKAIKELHPDTLEVVAINDLFDADVNAHLFKYDSNYGRYAGTVEVKDGDLVIDGKSIKVFIEPNPYVLPWADLGVDIVIESTGLFLDAKGTPEKPGANAHIDSGKAKKVIISTPAENEDLTIVLGVNDDIYDPKKHHIVSNASCTTNCLAPVAKIIHDNFTIKRGLMTTIHSYIDDQKILDLAHKDFRKARAAALNIIPTTTGAAKAVALVIPDLQGKFDGYALRVPSPTVSIVDFVAEVEKPTAVKELNSAFKEAAEGRMIGKLKYETDSLVSTDHKGSTYSSIIDAKLTTVMDGTFVKTCTWIHNEWGYSCRIVDLAAMMAKFL